MRIAVLGAGGWGTTLAILLSQNTHDVTLWSHRADHASALAETRTNRFLLPGIPLPPEIQITSDLEQAVAQADLLVTAVPAQYLRSVLKRMSQRDFRGTLIVNVAKGIENGSLMTMSEVISDVLGSSQRANIVTLSGPSFAEEVAKNVPTAVVAASRSLVSARRVQQTFMTPSFRIYTSADLRGVELGGSIKNVIAIGAGIADGAGFGDNTKAAIMTRATAEISRLGSAMGAQSRTFSGLSGIGDLIATCMSKHSRNRHVGEEIGKGRKLSDVLKEMVMVAEGVATTESVFNLSRHYRVEMPIVNEVYEVLFQDKDPNLATADLMTRDAKDEV